jgi:amidophosphoribosyltransferase
VRRKLNPIAQEFKNKKVLLVDDSIVRGTTSKQIIQLVRAVGADRLIYQDLEALIACVSDGNTRLNDFECSIFDGVYIAGRIEPPEPECPVGDRNLSTVGVVTCE